MHRTPFTWLGRKLDRFNLSAKQKQWIWFVTLWLFGLLVVSALGYAIKFLMFMNL